MTVELAMGNGQSDLVQPACPGQESRLVVVHIPGVAYLVKKRQGGVGDVVGLASVHPVAASQTVEGLEP